jgi:hypothetical protein
MTKRMLVVAGIVAATVAGFPSHASARGLDDIWDIVDALSGPGPFTGGPVIAATIGCRSGRAWRFTPAMSDPNRNDPCFYVDFRDLAVEPKGPYARVTAKMVETGVSFTQHRTLEIGAGVGVAYFATTVNGTDYNVTNFTVTPIRAVFKPLRLIPKWRDDPRAGFLQVQYRGTVRFGDIDGSDFGAPASTFNAGTEYLNGASLIIDVLQALRRQ